MIRPRLSLLDLAVVSDGSTEREALQRTVANARYAESLGLTRIWVAEHHGMPAVASSATDLLVGQMAAATSTIRVGSGGIMLGNHAPLLLAERFATLEAFAPGRIDMGLGRAPGTDPRTSWALRRDHHAVQGEALVAEIGELLAFFDGGFPADHHLAGMRAVPGPGLRPPLWLLGSSTFSAQVAALLGQRYAFANHFAPALLDQALAIYRGRFRPSADLDRPEVLVAATVICAPTDDEARHLASSGALAMVRLRRNDLRPLPSPEEATAHPWDELERAMRDQLTASWIVGDPARCAEGLTALQHRTGADELMLAGSVWDADAHRRGLALVVEAMAGRTAVAA